MLFRSLRSKEKCVETMNVALGERRTLYQAMTFRKPRSARHRARSRPASRPATPPAARASRGADRTVWIHGRHAVAAALANPLRRCRRMVATEEALAALARECGGPGGPFPPQGLALETLPRGDFEAALPRDARSEEHTSELQSPSFISYAVFCLKKKKTSPRKSTLTYSSYPL